MNLLQNTFSLPNTSNNSFFLRFHHWRSEAINCCWKQHFKDERERKLYLAFSLFLFLSAHRKISSKQQQKQQQQQQLHKIWQVETKLELTMFWINMKLNCFIAQNYLNNFIWYFLLSILIHEMTFFYFVKGYTTLQ